VGISPRNEGAACVRRSQATAGCMRNFPAETRADAALSHTTPVCVDRLVL